jgi:hypothetical protein
MEWKWTIDAQSMMDELMDLMDISQQAWEQLPIAVIRC